MCLYVLSPGCLSIHLCLIVPVSSLSVCLYICVCLSVFLSACTCLQACRSRVAVSWLTAAGGSSGRLVSLSSWGGHCHCTHPQSWQLQHNTMTHTHTLGHPPAALLLPQAAEARGKQRELSSPILRSSSSDLISAILSRAWRRMLWSRRPISVTTSCRHTTGHQEATLTHPHSASASALAVVYSPRSLVR